MRYRKTMFTRAAVIVAVLVVASACTTDDTSDADVTVTSTASAITEAPANTSEAVATTTESAPAAEATESPVAQAVSSPIPDTGQTACYDSSGNVIECPADGEAFFGQDASYSTNEPAYRDNGDGTVTDLVTGLMWQQDPGEKMTYDEAVAWADAAETAGYDDWRLPSITELYSLIDFSGTDPSGCEQSGDCTAVPFIDDVFAFSYGDESAGERLIDSQWATSTVYVGTVFGGAEAMFGVNFADGRIKGYPTEGGKGYFVLLVRGDEYGVSDYLDQGDGTVADLATGLVWQQGDSGTGMEWSEAIDYCETLDLGGSSEWRLPDAKELQSIVDYSRSPSTTDSAAIDPVFEATVITDEGGGANYGFYWSGTTHASLRNGASAVYVTFGEALGWMQSPQTGEYTLMDVHGAGAQRSDPKTGDASEYPYGHGPQGDVIRIDNLVRCVRSDDAETQSGTFADTSTTESQPPSSDQAPQVGSGGESGGHLSEAAAALGVSEEDLVAALGPPGSGPPDFAAAAAQLGVAEDLLRSVLPPPPEG